jgi:hypothetical protein
LALLILPLVRIIRPLLIPVRVIRPLLISVRIIRSLLIPIRIIRPLLISTLLVSLLIAALLPPTLSSLSTGSCGLIALLTLTAFLFCRLIQAS